MEAEASARLFEASLAEDSAFAMAAYYSARPTRGSRSQYLTRLRRAVALAAHAIVARGEDSLAVSEFRRAIFSTTFGYTRTNVELGRALIRLGRYAEAIAILEAALRGSLEAANLYVTHTEVRQVLADAYERSGDRDRAQRERAWVQRALSRGQAH